MKNPGRRKDIYEEQLNIWLLAVGIVSRTAICYQQTQNALIFKPLCVLVTHI